MTDDPRFAELTARLAKIKHEQKMQDQREFRRMRAVMLFHDAGSKKHRQWRRYCKTLIERGVDPQISNLILRMSKGVDVVPVLFRNKPLLAELVSKKTQRERAALLQRIIETPQ